MAQARIICVGNPWHPRDWVGPAVFATLARLHTGGVEVVDGGLQGLNLLRLMEDVERVVFADTLLGEADAAPGLPSVQEIHCGSADPGAKSSAAIAPGSALPQGPAPGLAFDHAGGLAYLLEAAPLVVSPMPRVWVVGAPAQAPRALVPALARACLELAHGGTRARC